MASAGVIASAAGLSSVLCWWSGVGAVASAARRRASPSHTLTHTQALYYVGRRWARSLHRLAYSIASPTACTRHASTVHPCTRPCFHTDHAGCLSGVSVFACAQQLVCVEETLPC